MVKRAICSCILCRRLEALPLTSKLCQELPAGRIVDAPPFIHVSVNKGHSSRTSYILRR